MGGRLPWVPDSSKVPEDGEPTVGGVRLPNGRRVLAGRRSQPVMWITAEVMDAPGALWASVQGPAQEAGLVAVILDDLDPFIGLPGYVGSARPWESGELVGVGESSVEDFDEAEVFRDRWKVHVPLGLLPESERPLDPFAELHFARRPMVEEDSEETAYFLGQVAPWGVLFPGLALAERAEIDPAVLRAAVEATKSGRIGLVPATRPADVPYRVGWQGALNHFIGQNQQQAPALLSVMMRSWEDRFGARLFRLGFDKMQFLVHRPPRSESSALAIAAEHFAFAGQDSVEMIRMRAVEITNSPTWDFWWD